MSIRRLNGIEFCDLAGQVLHGGHGIRFQATGASMKPFICDGDLLRVIPDKQHIRWGDIALVQSGEGKLLAHRVIRIRHSDSQPIFLLKGDSCTAPDGWFKFEQILGRVVAVEHGRQTILLTTFIQQWRARAWILVLPWLPKRSWVPKTARAYLRKMVFGGF